MSTINVKAKQSSANYDDFFLFVTYTQWRIDELTAFQGGREAKKTRK